MQQGKTSINSIPHQNLQKKEIFFHIVLQKTDSSELRGGTFAVFFSQQPDQLERNSLDRRQRQHLLYVSIKSHLSMTSVAEMGKESQEHLFQLIYQSDGIWHIHRLNTSYIAKNTKKSCKTPVTTCVTAF